MITVSNDQIDQYLDELDNLDEQEKEQLVTQFGEEQPYLLAYFMAVFEEELKQEERELIFYIGLQIWYVILRVNIKVPTISEELLEESEMDNEEMLNYLSEESEEGFEEFANNFLSTHPQRDLLEMALISVMWEEDEDDFKVSEDAKGVMFIILKTAIDCLHKVVNP